MKQRAHLGDCMEAMAKMVDNQYNLAISDPEYGINAGTMTMGKGSGNDIGRHEKKEWDNKPAGAKYFNELIRVSKNQIIWGGNYFIDHLKSTSCLLLWDKMDYYSDFASHEIAWTSFTRVVKCFRRARSKENDNKNKIHPTQKPVALYKWLLKNYAKEGDSILDTHLGSGSSRIAAYDMGFEFDGWELDKDYFEDQEKRFNNHISQLQIFHDNPTHKQLDLL